MLIYLLMISSLIFSAEKSYVDPAAKKEMAAKNDELIQKVLADPAVKEVYENCKKDQRQNLSDCLFDKLKEQGKYEEIKKKYLSGPKGGSKTDHDTTLIETRATKDPAILKLEEYLMKRLQEALYGEAKGEAAKRGKVVDHEAFYQLYQTQLSKNLISLISAYMIEVKLDSNEASPDNCKQVEADNRVSVRDENLAKLRTDPEGSSKKWAACLEQVPKICEGATPPNSHSVKNACEVTRGLKDIRQNLLHTGEILKQIKDSKLGNSDRIQDSKGSPDIYIAGSAEGEKSLDHLTGISSGELERSGFAAENEAMKNELTEKCLGGSEDPVCKQYLHDEEEKKKLDELAAEAEVRGKMISDKINDMNTPEEWKAYLKKEGRSDEEIEKLVANITELKDQIKKQYDAERTALIQKMKDRMGIRSSTKTDAQTNPPKISEIISDISSRTKNYAQLVQFNNVVSGYLPLSSEGNKNSNAPQEKLTNINAVKRELGDSAKDEKFGVAIADKSKLEETLKDKKSPSKTGELNVDVKTINEILRYKNSPEPAPK